MSSNDPFWGMRMHGKGHSSLSAQTGKSARASAPDERGREALSGAIASDDRLCSPAGHAKRFFPGEIPVPGAASGFLL